MKIKIVKDCLDNCNGFCCKYIILHIKTPDDIEDYRNWLSFHNCKLIFHKGKYIVKVPIKCKFLSDTGRCKIFKTEKRPIMCNLSDCPKEDTDYILKITDCNKDL